MSELEFKNGLERDLVGWYDRAYGDPKTRSERDLDARKSLQSFVTAGNSGGAIACMALIGAALGRQGSQGFPAEYLWILIGFLLGLLCCWLGYLSRARSIAAAWEFVPGQVISTLDSSDAAAPSKATEALKGPAHEIHRWRVVEFYSVQAGGVLLIVDGAVGVALLYMRAT